ncbi:hypothetical protein SLS53_005024 [Cytospora paraplurivora]|uniref:Uncharacterized protein n=1 Tax=Cytospora paraplurivora TaxID=2898453 RepID=A0AAN9U8I7_9PEZI
MEDPWGSPWATNDTNTTHELVPPKSTLEPPGRTVARQRSFSTLSPWATADDDGFSGWGTPDSGGLALPTATATSGASLWGGWGGDNGLNSSQTELTPRAREGSLSQRSHSPAWPAATSPALAQGKTLSRRSSTRSLFGHPSPDPWSADALNRLSLPTPALISAEQAAFSTLDRHDEEEEEEEVGKEETTKEKSVEEVGPEEMRPEAEEHTESGPEEKKAEEGGSEEERCEEGSAKQTPGKRGSEEGQYDGEEEAGEVQEGPPMGTEDDPHPAPSFEEESKSVDAVQLSDEDRAEATKPNEQVGELATEKGVLDEGLPKSPSHSRHSSFSAPSQHGERPDSPITSMDEDAKDRLPIPRRPSVNVQESVDPLDGSEKGYGDALTVPDPARGRRRSSIRSARTDDASDFGDFEDAQSVSSAPQSRRPSVNGSPRPPSSQAVRARSLSRTTLQGGRVSTVTPTEQRNTFHHGTKVASQLKFNPDLESVDKLFDVAKLDAEQPATKDYSLDYVDGVIKDNFTSISERKTWWRISRNGTMRMHDSGDDDNYRRITWATSKTREDTNKIVRRWMEQGSYPGASSHSETLPQ